MFVLKPLVEMVFGVRYFTACCSTIMFNDKEYWLYILCSALWRAILLS